VSEPGSAAAGDTGPAGQANRQLLDALRRSPIYQDYERAFTDATGLPLALRPVESWQLPHHGRRNENPFCALIAQRSRACAACLQVHQRLSDLAHDEPHTVCCVAGLSDPAVPIRLGDRLVGFMQTGQVFRKAPGPSQFERVAKLASEWGVEASKEELKEAYFGARVITPAHYSAMVQLLSIFSQHLSLVSNQIVVHQENSEPPMIARAKEFIQQHQTEPLSLAAVAKAVNASPFYFCKMFKKVTGLNFTDFVARVRTEKAKNLLLNPNLRISEIAFEVGFQSLTHFNRVFKQVMGQSPTDYRSQFPT
jgi:AraC-like DNA-binding protein